MKKCTYDPDWIEVDRQNHYHTIQNPKAQIKKHVVQYGPPRSGTTVVFQILCSLFENVTKTHSKVDVLPFEADGYFCSYRDPRDTVVSNWRVAANVSEKNFRYMDAMEVTNYCRVGDDLFSEMSSYQSKSKVIWLRYERYYDDYDYIFDKIEQVHEVKISEFTREKLKIDHGLERNKKISDELEVFSNHQHDSGIHGNHIFKGTPGTWKEFLTEDNQKLITKNLTPYLEAWNYEA